MSSKQRQKDKIKAKQRAMQESKEAGELDEELLQTEGLSKAILDSTSTTADDDPKRARLAVDIALAQAKEGEEIDPRLLQLFKDFKLYRVLVVAIVVIGFAVLLLAMFLYSNQMIDETQQNSMIAFANIVIVIGLVIAFGRARPIREDITAWNKVNELALKESNGKHGATTADIDKIFLNRTRNKRVPPDPKFKQYRRIWYGTLVCGSLLLVAAAILAQQNPTEITVPIICVVLATLLFIVGTVIERTKMKPMREAWIKELDEKVKKASKAQKRGK